ASDKAIDLYAVIDVQGRFEPTSRDGHTSSDAGLDCGSPHCNSGTDRFLAHPHCDKGEIHSHGELKRMQQGTTKHKDARTDRMRWTTQTRTTASSVRATWRQRFGA